MFQALVATIRNKFFYKLLFKRETPDETLIRTNFDNFSNSMKSFESYFLKDKKFLGGNDLNIADLIATSTFEQSFLTGYKKSPIVEEYINRCSEVIPEYQEILKDLKAAPEIVQKLEAKMFRK